MCGLVGIINKKTNGFTSEQNDVFDTLLFLDQLRGEDSTGVFSVSDRGEVFLAKEASDASEFRKSKEYEQVLRRSFANGAALIGHNRKATKGFITDENAHPFVVDDRIVLVHNGGVYGDHKKHADTEVDSHAIAHVINKADGDVEKALNSIDAAYALIWYDFKEEKLHMIRNKMRPLWYMETDSAFIWCSEKAMLDFAVTRHKITVTSPPQELEEDRLQTFSLNKGGWPIWKPTTRKIEIKSKGGNTGGTGFYPMNGEFCGYPTWGDAFDGMDDGAFENEGGSVRHPLERQPSESRNIMMLPEPQKPATQVQYPRSKINHEKLDEALKNKHMREFSGGTTRHNELSMLKKLRKGVEHQLFQSLYLAAYPYGAKVLAIPFDYAYANCVNDKGGFYMYSEVVNDSDVVIRHFWPLEYMNEDRLMKICTDGDYVYQFLVGNRQWIPFEGDNFGRQFSPSEEGGILIISNKLTLLYGGGVGDAKYKPERVIISTPSPTVH